MILCCSQAHRVGAKKQRLLSVLGDTGGPGVPATVGGGGAQRGRRTASARARSCSELEKRLPALTANKIRISVSFFLS